MSDNNMTDDAIAAEFAKLNTRLDSMEQRIVTKADVYTALLGCLGLVAAAIVGTVVVLSSVGVIGG